MPFVLDASVTLAWHFENEDSAYADLVLNGLPEDQALVPSIWPLEVANGLLAGERRGRITLAGVSGAVQDTLALPVTVIEVPAEIALGRLLDLARAHALTIYDAAYLDLAMREGLPLATEDAGLRAAATATGVPIFG